MTVTSEHGDAVGDRERDHHDERLDLLEVGVGPAHQLTGLGAVVEREVEPLEVGEEALAQVGLDPAGLAEGEVAAEPGEDADHDRRAPRWRTTTCGARPCPSARCRGRRPSTPASRRSPCRRSSRGRRGPRARSRPSGGGTRRGSGPSPCSSFAPLAPPPPTLTRGSSLVAGGQSRPKRFREAAPLLHRERGGVSPQHLHAHVVGAGVEVGLNAGRRSRPRRPTRRWRRRACRCRRRSRSSSPQPRRRRLFV